MPFMNLYREVAKHEKGIFIPEYIAWDFIIGSDVINSIRSKNKRKIVRKTQALLGHHAIEQRVGNIMDKEHFLFLLNFFSTTHQEKQHDFVLNDQWYENKIKQHRTIESLELWKESELIGMKMYSYDENGFFLSHKATLREYDKLLDLGLLLDYLSFLRARELGFKVCKTGKGKNLFGINLQLSLYEYKVSLGLEPHVAQASRLPKLSFLQTTLRDPFVAFCIISGEMRLFFVHPTGFDLQYIDKYKPKTIDIQPIEYEKFRSLEAFL